MCTSSVCQKTTESRSPSPLSILKLLRAADMTMWRYRTFVLFVVVVTTSGGAKFAFVVIDVVFLVDVVVAVVVVMV